MFRPHTHLRIALLICCALCLAQLVQAQQPEQKTATSYVLEGLQATQAGKPEEALRLYAAALKLDAKNFAAQFNSGTACMMLGRWEEAASFFKAADVIRPNDTMVQVAALDSEVTK